MNEKTKDWLRAIERPLRYLTSAGGKRVPAVKNLSRHVLDVSRQALSSGLGEPDVRLFRSLQELFSDFDGLAEFEKKDRIRKGLDLIAPGSGKRKFRCFTPADHVLPAPERLKEAHQRLQKNVQFLKGVGPVLAGKFLKADVRTVGDLLYFFPHRYEDRRALASISSLRDGMKATVLGNIEFAGVAFYKGLRRRVFEVVLEDGTGSLKLKWFHFGFGSLEDRLKAGRRMIVSGKVAAYRGKNEMHHPDFELFSGETDLISFGRVVPFYREIGGTYQKTLRKILFTAVTQVAGERMCAIPPEICERQDLLTPAKSLFEVHFPRNLPDPLSRSDAERTLSFEELFFYCLSLALRKKFLVAKEGIAFGGESPRREKLRAALPFRLTGAQEQVLLSIREDMALPRPMNRLLQGDVGSGKTVVAFLSALAAIDHGYQAVFLAPTEILAEQHFRTLSDWATTAGVTVDLLVGRHAAAARREKLQAVREGKTHVIVGTHALLESDVNFHRLGFVVVDEQHRFGVYQRANIRAKGTEPDVLVMSATPIPRTLALTLYGDLDVSILNELPAGRKPIETQLFREQDRNKVYELVKSEVRKGRQTFIVYPLVSASEKVDLKDATSMFEELKEGVFKDLRVALIHGQMPGVEKEKTMRLYAEGKIDVLVSTTVIEVGIDIPNATVMVIEHPERFGLSQLHQLRGRIGRGTERSLCVLIVPPNVGKPAKERLEIFSRLHDGFLLAEEDLRLRGPGDFFGVAQSGFPAFEVARFPRDLDLLEAARREAFSLLDSDPKLAGPGHRHLHWLIDQVWSARIALTRVG